MTQTDVHHPFRLFRYCEEMRMVEHQKYGPWQVFTASPEYLQETSYLTTNGQTLTVDGATGKASGLTFLQEVAFGLKWQEPA